MCAMSRRRGEKLDVETVEFVQGLRTLPHFRRPLVLMLLELFDRNVLTSFCLQVQRKDKKCKGLHVRAESGKHVKYNVELAKNGCNECRSKHVEVNDLFPARNHHHRSKRKTKK